MNVYEETFKKFGFSLTQQEILRLVGEGKAVLEIGASAGYMSRAFLKAGCILDVVERDQKASEKLPKGIRKIFNESIENKTVFTKLGKYDFIIMADVLEHLVNPCEVLQKLLKTASANTVLLISLPNVACWAMRKQLFFNGDFTYQDSGLLDKTHLHFYTVNSLPEILTKNGWKAQEIKGTITRLPFEGLIKIPVFGFIFKKVFYQRLVNAFKNLSYYHFLVAAIPNEKN